MNKQQIKQNKTYNSSTEEKHVVQEISNQLATNLVRKYNCRLIHQFDKITDCVQHNRV